MESKLPLARRSRPTSYSIQELEPDSRQLTYEDMFTALVPEPAKRKGTPKKPRVSVRPSLSGQAYLDQVLFQSRTKPLPPLPVDRKLDDSDKSERGKKFDLTFCRNALRRWKQLKTVGESFPKAVEKRQRDSSIESSASKASDIPKKDIKRPCRYCAQPYKMTPWSTKSTSAANCRSLMYGDLAEIPTMQRNPLGSRTTSPGRSKETASKKSDVEMFPRRGEDRMPPKTSKTNRLKLEGSDGKNEVTREQWEFLWNQYQQLSRVLQEALKQRTAELA